MMNDDRQSQQTEVEKLQQQNSNPERMSTTDEEQRISGRETGKGQQQMPMGTEKNTGDDDGTNSENGE